MTIGNNEEQVVFYYEIGQTITQWAMVENALFYAVSSNASTTKDSKALALGFFSVDSFRSKLKFSDNLLRDQITEQKHLKAWIAIQAELQKLSSKRNVLAHWQVRGYPQNTGGRRYALIPWIRPTGSQTGAKPPSGAICLRDIIKIRYDFFAIHQSLMNFGRRIRQQPNISQVILEPALPVPAIHAIKRQIHTILGHQP